MKKLFVFLAMLGALCANSQDYVDYTIINFSQGDVRLDNIVFSPQEITIRGSGGIVYEGGKTTVCPEKDGGKCASMSLWDAIRYKWDEWFGMCIPSSNNGTNGVTKKALSHFSFDNGNDLGFKVKEGAVVTKIKPDVYVVENSFIEINN